MNMFKLLLHITTICGIVFLFSCASDSMQESKIATEEAEPAGGGNSEYTTADFDIETLPENLSPEQQEAFQLRAKQKFQDFSDYLEILSDKKMNNDLKQHSYKLTMDLFLSDSTTIVINQEKKIKVLLKEYLSLLMKNKKSQKFNYKNIQFTENLKRDSLFNYSASITFEAKNISKTIDVYLIETKKQFGDSEQKTIEIKLGNIY